MDALFRRQAVGPTDEARARLDVAMLFRAHAQSVARWAARLGGPGLDVDDIVQEVFLAAHRRVSEFRGDAKITTWLFRATVRVVKHRRRRDRGLWRWLAGTPASYAAETACSALTPVEVYEQAQAARAVYRALERMSDRYRTLLIMAELEGLSAPELASLTGASVGAVWVGLHRARAQFAKQWRQEEGA